LSKYGPLTAIICLFLFGALLIVLGGNASPRTDVLLARADASQSQLSNNTTQRPKAQASALPPGVVYASDTDPVRILSVRISSDTLQAGDIASARVITTSNAAAMTARIGTYQVNVPRVAPGMFVLSMTVPHIYIPGHRAVIVVTAIRTDGATAQRSVPLHFSR